MTTVSVPLEMTSFDSKMGSFPITEKSPLTLTFTNSGVGKAKVEGCVRLVFGTNCDRCLEAVPITLDLTVDWLAVSPDVEAEDEDARNFLDGYQLDVEALVYDEILVNWPVKILCRPDCKGICPMCGRNLNAGSCGCDAFVPDPRMAVIKEIFNGNKEV